MKIKYLLHDTPFLGENQQYHYFYKIVNRLNGKYYYGIHSTKILDDGYKGSGINIRKAIQKYKTNNFEKHIIKFFHTRLQLLQHESDVITEQVVNDRKSYNATLGGKNAIKMCIADNRKQIIELETGRIIDSIQTLRKLVKRPKLDSPHLDYFISKTGYHYALYNEELEDHNIRQKLINQIEINIESRYKQGCQNRSKGHQQPWIDLQTFQIYCSKQQLFESISVIALGHRFDNGVCKSRGHYFIVYDSTKSIDYYKQLIDQVYQYENRKRNYYQAKKVMCVETGEIFESCREASKAMGLSKNSIVTTVNGYQKTAGGYHWQLI